MDIQNNKTVSKDLISQQNSSINVFPHKSVSETQILLPYSQQTSEQQPSLTCPSHQCDQPHPSQPLQSDQPPPSLRQHHHEKSSICDSRPRYRDGRHKTSVKVYSVGTESVYLLIRGLSTLPGSLDGVLKRVQNGLLEHKQLPNYPLLPSESFTMVILLKFASVRCARRSKKDLDDLNHMGDNLHCTYAPEFETISECRCKMEMRRRDVRKRLNYFRRQSQKDADRLLRQTQALKHEESSFGDADALLRQNALMLGALQGPSRVEDDEGMMKKKKKKMDARNDEDDEGVDDDIYSKLKKLIRNKRL